MNRDDLIRGVQERYRQTGRALNELQRRLWAATEALKLGRGGIAIVSKALRISPNTIKRGIQELEAGLNTSTGVDQARIRKPGGGRKPKRLSTAPNRAEASTNAYDSENQRRAPDVFDDKQYD